MTAKCPRCRKEKECREYAVKNQKVFICEPCSNLIVLEWIVGKLDMDMLKES